MKGTMTAKIFGDTTGPGEVSLEREGKDVLLKIKNYTEETHLKLSMSTFKKMVEEIMPQTKKARLKRRAKAK